MRVLIHSIIEVKNEVYPMKNRSNDHIKISHKKHKHTHKNVDEPKHVKYEREESSSSSGRFFKRIDNENRGIRQQVNVTVNVEQPKDDCLTGCFSGIAKCFGKA